jgi:hypothetical protein
MSETMSDLPVGFDFDTIGAAEPEGAFVLVGSEVSSRRELFDSYARALHFPSYFGNNWDAFVDCLSNLYWIDAGEVSVVHIGLPRLPTAELHVYLECLRDVLSSSSPSAGPQLRIRFRDVDQSLIESLLHFTDS